jgi:3-hydroxyisobutyrate dehydrogenase-like beta-hydroxyacid dehydrogenase
MTEAVALTGHYGVTPQTFIDLMLGTLFGGSRVYENYGAKIVKRDFEPGFSMKLGLKDLGLVAAAAEAAGRRLPMLEAVRARMAVAVAAGLGEKDWSAIADERADRSK